MADTVSVSQVKGSDFTWDSATFSWNDGDAGKSWAGASTYDYTVRVAETLQVSEVEANVLLKAIAESWSLAEKRNFSIALGILQSLGMGESFTNVGTFTLRISESLRMGEKLGNSFSRPLSETFKVTSASSRNPKLGVRETLAIAEAVSKKSGKLVYEALNLLEVNGISARKALVEQVAIAESRTGSLSKSISEALAVLEVVGRTVVFKRNFAESMSVQEAMTKAMRLTKFEAINVLEEYRRRANGVISDMSVLLDELDLFSFGNMVDSGHAPGFADFKDFIPGDYTYDQAIYRVILESINTDRARLRTLSVSVDVPDVTDRGSGTITIADQGLRVNFARSFHIPPEVTLTLKGGSVIAIPKIIGSVDTSGFTCALINPTDGTHVTGTFTWAAEGY
ncbi:hypothetical protein [Herbaspirillum huttiense]|uniref:Uncharacterized protein n=1 Tax=Herbaspirillum huttiense subsp. lycopersici TaxID=3074428 RepID=A0ABU2EGJ8_9BURK|nr:hypothetical protein [Herbaspirillum huttiense]MDR9847008.1 hypothetical protein [Herbaspirillum huttiense SE1]